MGWDGMVGECDALENLETYTIFCWKIETKDVVDCYTLISSGLNWGLGSSIYFVFPF
jgi:hypothetical protein